MAPPRSQPRQLDEISESLGRLDGRFEGIERYIHDHRHEVGNVSMKIDALSRQIAKDMAGVEERMRVRFEAVEKRLEQLESARAREEGAKGVLIWIVQSPLVGWIAAAAIAFVTWWKANPR